MTIFSTTCWPVCIDHFQKYSLDGCTIYRATVAEIGRRHIVLQPLGRYWLAICWSVWFVGGYESAVCIRPVPSQAIHWRTTIQTFTQILQSPSSKFLDTYQTLGYLLFVLGCLLFVICPKICRDWAVLFSSLAILDPRVGHTMDVLSLFISVLCHSDWLFHGVLSMSRCCPSRPYMVFLACVHLTVFLALCFLQATSLFPHGVT